MAVPQVIKIDHPQLDAAQQSEAGSPVELPDDRYGDRHFEALHEH